MMRVGALLVLLLQAFAGVAATAHELRPAYLDMREKAPGEFAVLWKVPALGDLRLGLYVRLPEACKAKAEPVSVIEAGAFFERWTAACPDGLKGQQIIVDGLRSTATDVLVRIEYRNRTTQVARLTPESPALVVADVQAGSAVAITYFSLGVDHIITGFDHLLFILGLMLLIRDRWMLVKTITAFTVAHSITLAGAVLGYLSLPQKPVEAAIAVSIAFVASELVKAQSGARRLSEVYPWIVAFAFGLLHGFGFAGALKETGLPQVDVPLALFTFNLGVEAGQLLFIGAALIVFKAVSAFFTVPIAQGRLAAAYLIGTTSMVWLVMRVSAFGI
jgi:hydrogenase/urease accessory protein HupE